MKILLSVEMLIAQIADHKAIIYVHSSTEGNREVR